MPEGSACFVNDRLLILLLIASFLPACTSDPGRLAYVDTGCPLCHGSNLVGGRMGPDLTNLRQNWTPRELDTFLKNPSRYSLQVDRIRELAKRYPAPMPAFRISEEGRRHLVDYLMRDRPE